ncbi:UDP-galactopyranose mutase [Parabacteroides sp. AF18-52]|uniref:UDP-galactopyranose mutase n=1 Tax=Parabacteroides sp. AF18-52 TaxID=2292242 RepID=UPI000EFE4D61|nr:UDP-galactopyranose mutase [Parabacteroides sp. AF18-52]RHR40323.1 UDP-galactopyranose mutase [Parabacteroides sp. AF18-52]
MKKYDYLVVGAGLYGSMFAYKARKVGRKVLVIEKRFHTGGNLYCENIEGINVHKYGPHIFHTSNKEVWDFVNSIVPFNHFRYEPLASYKGKLYNLPFNMNTFHQLWGVNTPDEAKSIIDEQRKEFEGKEPQNLEEQAISLVGRDVYETLIKGYTEKQWGRKCTELPAFIIRRLPVRFCYNNNYFNDCYQGIPMGGYNKLIEGLLEGVDIRLNVDFFKDRESLTQLADRIVFTGKIDEFYDYLFGKLDYRSLRFEEEILDKDNYQGNIAVNYTDTEHTCTRIIEHKYFEFGTQSKTVITKEYSLEWTEGCEPYYPVNDQKNTEIYQRYKMMADQDQSVIFGGRLAEYKYYDMHQIVEKILNENI